MSGGPSWHQLNVEAEADRGPTVRRGHPGALDKLFWWYRYADITTRALNGPARAGKWPHRVNYIDLFAGPGVLEVEGRRRPGSPMIASRTREPFDRMIFCELDPANASALSDRLSKWGAAERSEVRVRDCNDEVDRIAGSLGDDSLSLAFIDPTGLQFRWDSLAALTAGAAVDFLILIPDRIDIVRNLKKLVDGEDPRLDSVLGPDSGWREETAALPDQTSAEICKAIGRVYERQLSERLGYLHTATETIRKGSGVGQSLYTILFASRNPLGTDFWRKSVQELRQGGGLPFSDR